MPEPDLDLLKEFERGLDPQHPEQSKIPASILGYGEISTVIAVDADGLRGLAFKRLPLFRTPAEIEPYQRAYDEYNRLLANEIGLDLPPHGTAWFPDARGRPIFYIIQKQLASGCIAHRALHSLSPEQTSTLVTRVMGELCQVWTFNRKQDRIRIGIDGQLSNWSLQNWDPAQPDLSKVRLMYVDTSTPLFRVDGKEQLDTELFLRSAPSFLVWALRLFFLKDVVDRYYDFHLVAVDLAANLFKEQRPELIPGVVDAINAYFAGPAADLGCKPVTVDEVNAYYREDAFIWSLYLSMRKIDRWLRTRLLRRDYPYILPPAIRR